MTTDVGSHWENIYRTKAPDSVSWFRPHLEQSLSLIERAVPQRTAAIIDVGAGESTLVDDLLGRGYTNLTLLDVSRKALAGRRTPTRCWNERRQAPCRAAGARKSQSCCWVTLGCGGGSAKIGM